MNNIPFVLQAFIGILNSLSGAAALCCFVLAGLRLRAEGGVNYDAGGGFFRWMAWGAVFVTLPQIGSWLALHNVPIDKQAFTFSFYTGLPYAETFVSTTKGFVNEIVIAKLVPVIASLLVFKALLDSAEGHSFLPSLIAAMFLLGVKGIFNMAEGSWSPDTPDATVVVLRNMFLYLATVISPIIGALCVVGAIFTFLQEGPWRRLVASGLAFMCVPGIWYLVQKMAGVSL